MATKTKSTKAPLAKGKPSILDPDAELMFERNVAGEGKVKLTAPVISMFCRLARQGRPLAWICNLLGIQQSRVFKWMSKGEDYVEDPEPELKIYFEFCCRWRQALCLYLAEIQDKQATGAAGEWVRYAWILERLDPKTFGRKDLNTGPVDDGAGDKHERYL